MSIPRTPEQRARRRAYIARWRSDNAEKIRTQVAAWDAANPTKRSAIAAAWRAGHREQSRLAAGARRAQMTSEQREKTRAVDAAWRAANAERVRTNTLRWQATHPDKVRESRARAYVRRSGAETCSHPGCLAIGPVQLAWQTSEHRCYLCGTQLWLTSGRRELGHVHMDHVMPISRGGLHCAQNLRPTCAPCNLAKHAKTPTEAWSPTA